MGKILLAGVFFVAGLASLVLAIVLSDTPGGLFTGRGMAWLQATLFGVGGLGLLLWSYRLFKKGMSGRTAANH